MYFNENSLHVSTRVIFLAITHVEDAHDIWVGVSRIMENIVTRLLVDITCAGMATRHPHLTFNGGRGHGQGHGGYLCVQLN